ncbi:MAG TPA: complex I subunit 1 family protein [Planctomycetota bacterium]|jgi:NADH-quinone oxidoreductase subunit H
MEFWWLKLIPIVLVLLGVLGIVPILVYYERKVCAWIQNRVGPNRVGLLGPESPLGLIGIKTSSTSALARLLRVLRLDGVVQPFADAVKLLSKEFFIPAGADKLLYLMAPAFALLPPLIAYIVVPIGPDILYDKARSPFMLQVADLNVGILFVLAVASLSAYGVAFGGWASNNKYSLLGGVRAMAQMVSYEVAMGIVILSIVMTYDTVSLRDMVYQQAGGVKTGDVWDGVSYGIWDWGIRRQPLAFILFTICAFAENNRLPFDLPECEAELVGGYHTEYNSMGFGMFFQGEYIAMLTMGALIATMFLGGWHYPFFWQIEHLHPAFFPLLGPILAALIGLLVFSVKVLAFIFFSMWVRWTLPRFRWDQLMNLGWKIMIPLALGNLVLTAFLGLSGQR